MHRAKKRKRASVERRELTRQIQFFVPSLRGDRDILLAALTYILIHTLSYFYHTLLPVSHCTFFLTYTYFQSLDETRLTAPTLSFFFVADFPLHSQQDWRRRKQVSASFFFFFFASRKVKRVVLMM